MHRFITGSLLLLTLGATAANAKSVTFYTDGIIIEREATALKGILEIPLPAGTIEGSLRIKPASGTRIQRVDILPLQADLGKAERELDSLLEQKSRLGDRLLALSTREEIFKSAAKSQSGKAPRKSKSNPEPMQSIRQGTEFAIAQLEAVYTARRKTEQDIRRLDNRIAAAKSGIQGATTYARILLSPPRGNVSIRYAVNDRGWTPRYDIHLNGSGNAQAHLSGQFPGTYNGYLLQASPSRLTSSSTAGVFPVQPGPAAGLTTFKLGATEELFEAGIWSSLSCELKNLETVHLPAGEANIYRSGEYLGRVRFEGLSSGSTRRIAVGK